MPEAETPTLAALYGSHPLLDRVRIPSARGGFSLAARRREVSHQNGSHLAASLLFAAAWDASFDRCLDDAQRCFRASAGTSLPPPLHTSTRSSARPSRLSGAGCPRRRPALESTPRSALLGSRTRRSSCSPCSGSSSSRCSGRPCWAARRSSRLVYALVETGPGGKKWGIEEQEDALVAQVQYAPARRQHEREDQLLASFLCF